MVKLSASLAPKKVLYFFQEPQIFVSDVDGFPLLCLKVDEIKDESVYLVVPTSTAIIENAVSGRISLKAAFYQPWCWVVQTNTDFRIKGVKQFAIEQIPSDYFPEPGVGLYPHHGKIRDAFWVDEKPFMAVKFEGEDLKEGVMRFNTFATLVADTYSSLRRIFLPVANAITHSSLSEGAVGRILQIPMRQTPRFASLSIEIERPEIEVGAIKRKIVIDKEALPLVCRLLQRAL